VDLDGNTLAVVPHRYFVFLGLDLDLDHIHCGVSLKIVSCIHKNFI
jgi:hypothetical protein